ncbi:MAG: SDR family oxidoreductase [Halieaceae bacterium]|jgi:2-hydroxycyclohexanecarboxyl-CoA dehydrogenase|nr:SDR family oxidoreductase [Halieaceae bacterium]
MKGLAGKTAIVTGGGSGIGEAIVMRLAQEGCRVALFDINAKAGEEVAVAAEGEVVVFKTDITNFDAVQGSVAAAEEALGPVWMLVNCAGWDAPSPFLTQEPELWHKIINLNLYGPLYMHHAVCKRMSARGEGRVINIASDAGRVGTSNEAVYSACKGGTISFTKSMARELAKTNVLVNAICPGPTDTPAMEAVVGSGPEAAKWKESMARGVPLRRMGAPGDYPGIVAFLGSEDAGYITGQTISVSGGLSMS